MKTDKGGILPGLQHDFLSGQLKKEAEMYELVKVSERCYYINCLTKIGVYIADKDNVCLIDSGKDK